MRDFSFIYCLLLCSNRPVWSSQGTKESAQASRDSANDKANENANDKVNTTEAPITDSSSVSATSKDSKRVSPQDIEFVR